MVLVDIVENRPFPELQGDETAFLRRRLGARFQRRADGWVIVRVVGRIALPSGRLLRIRSEKAPAAALLAWIGYVDPSMRALRDAAVLPDIADDGDIFSCMARLYLEALISACTQNGLVRGYRPEGVQSACIRGRINFPRFLATGQNLAKVPCVAWARALDTPLNRLLVAAIERIAGDVLLCSEHEPLLQTVRRWFHGVPATVAPGLLHGHMSLGRAEAAFQAAFEFARSILLHSGLGDGSRIQGYSFYVDLEQYFERAVVRAFKDAGIACEAKRPLHYAVLRGSGRYQRSMAPDLYCELPDGPLIVDAKFKPDVSSANIQQMVTYCMLTGARRAVLVLPGGAQFDDGYILQIPGERALEIRVVGLDTLGRTVAGWRECAAAMVRRVIDNGGQSRPRPRAEI
ncbi:5-methylcytosine restriction system specificity protein McrC [Nannocystis radixulma]|uniref:GxxExxY protein n=1 Tax=Nannocystis radixulma TaxID=2995305 RepID=A0ABT5BEX7_9BACT|nr:GxxExxY protein [Nannocystis radixulma]MDC0672694.1 GxxExxY protein [Nannocystis radixulma]